MSLQDLSIRDLEWVVGIRGVRSLRDFARLKRVQVAHASKVFQNIESELGVRLFHRSPTGIQITDEGSKLIELCEEMLSYGEKIRDFTKRSKKTQGTSLTIAALSFIQNFLTIPSLEGLKERFRVVEINPNLVPQLQLMHEVDILIHLGKVDWPESLETVEIGEIKFDFYIHSRFFQKELSVNDLYKIPFVLPTYFGNGRFIVGNDRCPIPMHLRIKGDESTTAHQAVQFMRRDRQVAFLPDIVVRKEVSEAQIQRLKFSEFSQVCETVYLSVKVDKVSKSTFDRLAKQLRKTLT